MQWPAMQGVVIIRRETHLAASMPPAILRQAAGRVAQEPAARDAQVRRTMQPTRRPGTRSLACLVRPGPWRAARMAASGRRRLRPAGRLSPRSAPIRGPRQWRAGRRDPRPSSTLPGRPRRAVRGGQPRNGTADATIAASPVQQIADRHRRGHCVERRGSARRRHRRCARGCDTATAQGADRAAQSSRARGRHRAHRPEGRRAGAADRDRPPRDGEAGRCRPGDPVARPALGRLQRRDGDGAGRGSGERAGGAWVAARCARRRAAAVASRRLAVRRQAVGRARARRARRQPSSPRSGRQG